MGFEPFNRARSETSDLALAEAGTQRLGLFFAAGGGLDGIALATSGALSATAPAAAAAISDDRACSTAAASDAACALSVAAPGAFSAGIEADNTGGGTLGFSNTLSVRFQNCFKAGCEAG